MKRKKKFRFNFACYIEETKSTTKCTPKSSEMSFLAQEVVLQCHNYTDRKVIAIVSETLFTDHCLEYLLQLYSQSVYSLITAESIRYWT